MQWMQNIWHGNNQQLLAKLLPSADRISFRCLPQKSSGKLERSLENFCRTHFHLNGPKTRRWLKIYQQDIRMTAPLEVVSLSSSRSKLYICWIEMNEFVTDTHHPSSVRSLPDLISSVVTTAVSSIVDGPPVVTIIVTGDSGLTGRAFIF